ncbi:MAG: TIGR04255 family protein [Motiliproteus sp.]
MNDRLGQLKTPPLLYTLVVIRFSEIQKMADYVPDIQEELRRTYPNFDPTPINGVTIEHNPNGESKVTTNQSMQWSFSDAERQWGVLLQSNLLLFHTTQYEHFDDFGERLKSVLNIIKSKADITHYHTLGLRYIDAIMPKSGRELSDYISDRLLPFQLTGISTSSGQSRSEHRYTNEQGVLCIRSHALDAGETIPADIKDTADQLTVQTPHSPGKFVILDTDHTHRLGESGKVQLQPFNINVIVNTLDLMHKNASAAFKSAITERALTEWSEG